MAGLKDKKTIELRELAKKRQLKCYAKLSRNELISLIYSSFPFHFANEIFGEPEEEAEYCETCTNWSKLAYHCHYCAPVVKNPYINFTYRKKYMHTILVTLFHGKQIQ